MSQPDAQPNEPSKMKKLLNGGDEAQPLLSKLPKAGQGKKAVAAPPKKDSPPQDLPKQPEVAPRPREKTQPIKRADLRSRAGGLRFLPAFWTVASVMSFAVNLVLLIVLAIVLQNLKTIGVTATALPDHLLAGLYTNFVKMDEAHIRANIPVRKEIPVNFSLNVSGPTSVKLSENVTITGATVTVFTGGLNITNARANIVLPKDTILPIIIENLVVPVDQKVLAELDVAVDIPLNQTDLHEPFVGLQEVVRPFYCMINDCP